MVTTEREILCAAKKQIAEAQDQLSKASMSLGRVGAAIDRVLADKGWKCDKQPPADPLPGDTIDSDLDMGEPR
jgi:hypothetical protein